MGLAYYTMEPAYYTMEPVYLTTGIFVDKYSMCIVQNAKGCANVFLCMCLWAFLDGSIVGERRGGQIFTKKIPFPY